MKKGNQKRLVSQVPVASDQHQVQSGPIRGAVEDQLERLKQHLLQPMLAGIGDTPLGKEISWAANEAAALAWCTVCPVLMLPTLLEEKVSEARNKWQKQQELRQGSTSRAGRVEPVLFCEAA